MSVTAGKLADTGQMPGFREMVMFNTDFARSALAAVGALIFSVTTVGAAVGPARLAEITPVVYADAAPLVEGTGHA